MGAVCVVGGWWVVWDATSQAIFDRNKDVGNGGGGREQPSNQEWQFYLMFFTSLDFFFADLPLVKSWPRSGTWFPSLRFEPNRQVKPIQFYSPIYFKTLIRGLRVPKTLERPLWHVVLLYVLWYVTHRKSNSLKPKSMVASCGHLDDFWIKDPLSMQARF